MCYSYSPRLLSDLEKQKPCLKQSYIMGFHRSLRQNNKTKTRSSKTNKYNNSTKTDSLSLPSESRWAYKKQHWNDTIIRSPRSNAVWQRGSAFSVAESGCVCLLHGLQLCGSKQQQALKRAIRLQQEFLCELVITRNYFPSLGITARTFPISWRRKGGAWEQLMALRVVIHKGG